MTAIKEMDLSKESPEIIAYIEALQKQNLELQQQNQKVQKQNQEIQKQNQAQAEIIKQQEEQLVKMQALNEMLVKVRKKMFGKSSEQVKYLEGEQISFFNEARRCERTYRGNSGQRTRPQA